MIEKQLVDRLFAQFGTDDITQLSIREVGKLVSMIEKESGEEFIHMEMGVPGLPPTQVGLDAEKEALEMNGSDAYLNIIQNKKDKKIIEEETEGIESE